MTSTTSKQNVTAARISRENNDDVACYRHGIDMASPVLIYTRSGEWTSTPFQHAGFRPEQLARWLFSEGGCPSRIAAIHDDGSASVYLVEFDSDGEPIDCDHEEDKQYTDEYVEALPREDWADGGSDSSRQDIADSWRESGLSVEEMGEYLSEMVWDADKATALRDAGIIAEDLHDLNGKIEHPCTGYSLGYAVANNDVSIDDILEAMEIGTEWIVVRQDTLEGLQDDGTWGNRGTAREYDDHDQALEDAAAEAEKIGRMVTVQEINR